MITRFERLLACADVAVAESRIAWEMALGDEGRELDLTDIERASVLRTLGVGSAAVTRLQATPVWQ